ncbi:GNAT family N-acetyltransferase [Kaarinaea lacus]
MSQPRNKIRSANKTDLDAINLVTEAAVMTWDLPERVKRLSLSSYRYNELDFDHLDMVVAEDSHEHIIGVASWEPAEAKDAPAGHTALLLHGIYVNPSYHRRGIGQQLFRAAEHAVRKHHFDGLLVKAQQDANDFFLSMGMSRLPIEDPKRHYANRFWKRADQ